MIEWARIALQNYDRLSLELQTQYKSDAQRLVDKAHEVYESNPDLQTNVSTNRSMNTIEKISTQYHFN